MEKQITHISDWGIGRKEIGAMFGAKSGDPQKDQLPASQKVQEWV